MAHSEAFKKGIEKASREIEEKLRTISGNKTNIGVLIDADIWRNFRIHCLETGRAPGETLTSLISKYLDGGSK
jgi:hypothetical protein